MPNFVRIEKPKVGSADVPEGAVESYKEKGWKPVSEPRSYEQAAREAADREAESTTAGKTGQSKEK